MKSLGYEIELENKIKKLVKREDGFWKHLKLAYHIETREELEKESKNWSPSNPLVVALHHIWKRDANVEKLEAENKKLKEAVEILIQADHNIAPKQRQQFTDLVTK